MAEKLLTLEAAGSVWDATCDARLPHWWCSA